MKYCKNLSALQQKKDLRRYAPGHTPMSAKPHPERSRVLPVLPNLGVSRAQDQRHCFCFSDPSELGIWAGGRNMQRRLTSNHLLVCNPRKIHAHASAKLVLI